MKTRLRDVAEGVLDGTVDRAKASVAFQGLGVLIRAIETERKLKEQDELVERLEQLEQTQEQRGGYSVWGR